MGKQSSWRVAFLFHHIFLEYMNLALEKYQSYPEIASIHGYVYPVISRLSDSFFINGADCWGWGAWKRAWDKLNWDGIMILADLKNLSSRSSVLVMSYTHEVCSFPTFFSDNTSNKGSNQQVLDAAKKLDSRCELKTFCLEVGEFIVWSGKAWHATINESNLIRHSIILQYCSPDANVRIPITYTYPNKQWSIVKPLCLPISGNFLDGGNFLEANEKTSYVNEILRAIFDVKGCLMQLARLIITGHS